VDMRVARDEDNRISDANAVRRSRAGGKNSAAVGAALLARLGL
jgi:hypothetical protein